MMKKKEILKSTVSFLSYYFLFLLIVFPIWLNKKFGDVYFEQFLVNLQLAWYGYLDGDHHLVASFYKWNLIIPITISLSLLSFKLFIYDISKNNKKIIKIIIYNFKNFIKILNKLIVLLKLIKIISIIFEKKIDFIIIFVFVLSGFYFNSLFFKDFKINKKNSFIENNYVEYRALDYKNDNKNLVIIYVESLENTYSNQDVFGEDLLVSISNENIKGKSVDKFIEVEGYGFTLASLIATQCGLPLKSVGLFNSASLDVFENFLPNLKCLSDIFKLSDYHNVFLTSDELKGSGFKNFLNSHNFDESYGLKELKELGYKTSKTAWHNKKNWYGGIHDDELLRATLDNIKELEKKNSNYFVTVFTLDTHAPEGYLNPKCVTELSKDQEITLAVKCTVLALKDFINNFNELKLQNTNLVILGDHLFMAGSDGFNNKEYFKSQKRYIFNKFISNESKSFNRDNMNFFDLYPSLLEYSGFKIKNGRLGLGSSIFNEFRQDLYLFEDQNFLKKLSGESKFYNKLWQ